MSERDPAEPGPWSVTNGDSASVDSVGAGGSNERKRVRSSDSDSSRSSDSNVPETVQKKAKVSVCVLFVLSCQITY